MRKLAKDLHVSIITTQRAYEELAKDGFIHIVPAKGAFVSSQNKDFIKEENRRRIESLLQESCTIARENDIQIDELIQMIKLLFEEDI